MHPLSGDLEPPELHWLIAQLIAINRKGRADAVILKHAYRIHGLWLALRGHSDNVGYKIKGKTRLRAERVKAIRGAKNELLRLRKAAKNGSAKIFQTAWLAVSGKTRGLVWKPRAPPVIKRQFDKADKLVAFERAPFDARGLVQLNVRRLHGLMPSPANALPPDRVCDTKVR